MSLPDLRGVSVHIVRSTQGTHHLHPPPKTLVNGKYFVRGGRYGTDVQLSVSSSFWIRRSVNLEYLLIFTESPLSVRESSRNRNSPDESREVSGSVPREGRGVPPSTCVVLPSERDTNDQQVEPEEGGTSNSEHQETNSPIDQRPPRFTGTGGKVTSPLPLDPDGRLRTNRS